MINAERYCKFVKVIGPLSPEALPELQASPLIVSAALSWGRRVTPRHVSSAASLHRADSGSTSKNAGLLSSVTGPASRRRCHNGLYVASRKIRSTASVTHTWQSVITGALYCIPALKVVQVSMCLNVRQSGSYTHLTAHSGSFFGWSEARRTIV